MVSINEILLYLFLVDIIIILLIPVFLVVKDILTIKIVLEKYNEKREIPIKSDWIIHIKQASKQIKNCFIFFNDTPLPWDDQNIVYYEKNMVKGGKGNVLIPGNVLIEGKSFIIVKNGKNIIKKVKFEEIPISKN